MSLCAEPKPLIEVLPSVNIEKMCGGGKLFGTTKFGKKSEGPIFAYYRTKGMTGDGVVSTAAITFDDDAPGLTEPTADLMPDQTVKLRVSPELHKVLDQCFQQ